MYKILPISDIHMGSYWGPVAPDTHFKDSRTGDVIHIDQSETNRFIYNHWELMCRECRDVDCIIVNGDAVDGINTYKNHGAVFTDDLYVQIKLCADLLNMLPDVPMYITKGTGFHSGDQIKAERLLADIMGATYADEMVIEECGLKIFANHHIAHGQNKAASLERKMKEFAACSQYYDYADTLVFSHNHAFTSIKSANYLGIMTPGWQGKTPYASERNLLTPSDIGWITINVYDDGCTAVDTRGITHQPQLCQFVGRNLYDREAYRN